MVRFIAIELVLLLTHCCAMEEKKNYADVIQLTRKLKELSKPLVEYTNIQQIKTLLGRINEFQTRVGTSVLMEFERALRTDQISERQSQLRDGCILLEVIDNSDK
jgi:hypothetical protein